MAVCAGAIVFAIFYTHGNVIKSAEGAEILLALLALVLTEVIQVRNIKAFQTRQNEEEHIRKYRLIERAGVCVAGCFLVMARAFSEESYLGKWNLLIWSPFIIVYFLFAVHEYKK